MTKQYRHQDTKAQKNTNQWFPFVSLCLCGNSSGSSGLGQSAKISYVEKFIGLGKDND